jgi:hypothetical protein
VYILRIVGVLVVMAVVVSPPKWTALHGGGAPYCQDELAKPRGAVCFVGEISVVNACDGKHSYNIQRQGYRDSSPAPSDQEYTKAAEVKEGEGEATDKFDSVGLLASGFSTTDSVIGVEPLYERGE